ncbi:LDL receptor repeat-containing protein egg-1-like [Physella acuta]|uniref:LDL receptor repeat-containing protein egg-1-like n=1 Tax=Physella acuta TaxID=109671 RepID=UPI0027DB5968|nr:LDL receptor repeat-containing protein egg-1-like [Physella acuta]
MQFSKQIIPCSVLVKCGSNQFACYDQKQCVSESLVCNNVNDCHDGSDEATCNSCQENQWMCSGVMKCVPKSARCNKTSECSDNSDEQNCPDGGNNRVRSLNNGK